MALQQCRDEHVRHGQDRQGHQPGADESNAGDDRKRSTGHGEDDRKSLGDVPSARREPGAQEVPQ